MRWLSKGWEHFVGLFGLILLGFGSWLGLIDTPPDVMMGEAGRILYVHVPAAWLCLVCYTIAFVGSIGYMFSGRHGFDWANIAAVEVGVLLNVLLLLLGMLFARPTWNIWWSWDPRLTASLIMMLTFAAILLLRRLLEDPEQRALYTSVATLLAYVNIPITYFAVRWRSIHQLQSSPDTMSDVMVFALRINAFAFLFLSVWFIARRWRIEQERIAAEAPPPLPEVA